MHDPSLGRTVADRAQLLTSGGLTIKTTVDLGSSGRPTKRRRPRVKPTDQAIGALAMVEPGTGEVLGISQSRPMGREREEGRDVPQLRRGQQVRRLGRLPGRLDLQDLRAGGRTRAGAAQPRPKFKSPAQVHIPQNDFTDCDGPYPVTSTWTPAQLHQQRHPVRHVQGHAALGEHLLRPARAQDRPVRALRPRQGRWASTSPTPTGSGSPPSRSVSPSVSPLEMAGAYATVAARGEHCDDRPVTQILNSRRQALQEVPAEVQAGDPAPTPRTPSTTSCKGVMAPGRLRAGPRPGQAVGGQDRNDQQDNTAVWFDGYTPKVATAAVVAGANSRASRSP